MSEEERLWWHAISFAVDARHGASLIEGILKDGKDSKGKIDPMKLQDAIQLAAEARSKLKYIEVFCERMSGQ